MAQSNAWNDKYTKDCYHLPLHQSNVTQAFYDKWSQQFDHDTTQGTWYEDPQIMADIFARYADVGGEILEIGCGTGRGGLALTRLGVTTLDGVDISPGMLEKARLTRVYRKLSVGDLLKQLPVPTGSYDSIFAAGAMGPGHVGPQAFSEFARIVKPGGLIVVNVDGPDYVVGGFEAEIKRLVENGVFKILYQATAPKAEDFVFQTPSAN